MARRGGVERIMVGVAKAVYKAHKQTVRDAERQKKAAEKEAAREAREQERLLRQSLKENNAAKKEAIKREIEEAKASYEKRCKERDKAKVSFINMELK